MHKLLILCLLFSQNVYSESKPKLVKYIGEFEYLSPKDKRNLYGFEHYFIIEEKGKTLAYPVIASKKLLQKIRRNPNKIAFVKAKVQAKSIRTVEQTKKIAVLDVENVTFLKLTSLSPPNTEYRPNGIKIGKGHASIPHHSQGILKVNGINDTVTNTLIFAGGAALIGSMFIK